MSNYPKFSKIKILKILPYSNHQFNHEDVISKSSVNTFLLDLVICAKISRKKQKIIEKMEYRAFKKWQNFFFKFFFQSFSKICQIFENLPNFPKNAKFFQKCKIFPKMQNFSKNAKFAKKIHKNAKFAKKFHKNVKFSKNFKNF